MSPGKGHETSASRQNSQFRASGLLDLPQFLSEIVYSSALQTCSQPSAELELMESGQPYPSEQTPPRSRGRHRKGHVW